MAATTRCGRDLAEAIAANRLDLHYMPKLRLRDETIAGAEALCRWTHPLRGPVSPDLFIRLAEEGGLIAALTLWGIGRAIEDQDRLRAQGIDVAFDVNMSARLICDRAFCDRVIAQITGRGRTASGWRSPSPAPLTMLIWRSKIWAGSSRPASTSPSTISARASPRSAICATCPPTS